MLNPVLVTGMGIISSAGLDKESFWNSISKGIPAIKPISKFDTSEFRSHKAGEITNFNPRDYIKGKNVKYLSGLATLAIAASSLALKDAGLTVNSNNTHRIGIVLGNIYCGWETSAELYKQMREDKLKRVSPFLFPNTVPNSPAGQIAIELGIKGPNASLITGFASGTDAIGYGLNYLRLGKVDTVIAGGAEELTPWLFGNFDKSGCLSQTSADYQEECLPFDKKRNGMVLGEGAAMLILETAENAKQRAVQGYAQIMGYASTYDVEKNGGGLERAIKLALEEAGIQPQDVNYINAEGNGLVSNDRTESYVLKKIFGELIYKIPVSSIKPVIGHALGAAGAFDAIACILAMQYNLIPPTLNYKTSDPECGLDYVPSGARKKEINVALSLSSDFQGNNACLVFKKIKG